MPSTKKSQVTLSIFEAIRYALSGMATNLIILVTLFFAAMIVYKIFRIVFYGETLPDTGLNLTSLLILIAGMIFITAIHATLGYWGLRKAPEIKETKLESFDKPLVINLSDDERAVENNIFILQDFFKSIEDKINQSISKLEFSKSELERIKSQFWTVPTPTEETEEENRNTVNSHLISAISSIIIASFFGCYAAYFTLMNLREVSRVEEELAMYFQIRSLSDTNGGLLLVFGLILIFEIFLAFLFSSSISAIASILSFKWKKNKTIELVILILTLTFIFVFFGFIYSFLISDTYNQRLAMILSAATSILAGAFIAEYRFHNWLRPHLREVKKITEDIYKFQAAHESYSAERLLIKNMIFLQENKLKYLRTSENQTYASDASETKERNVNFL